MKILKEFKEIEKQNLSFGNLQKKLQQMEDEVEKLKIVKTFMKNNRK